VGVILAFTPPIITKIRAMIDLPKFVRFSGEFNFFGEKMIFEGV
jgi:hypothetical protein